MNPCLGVRPVLLVVTTAVALGGCLGDPSTAPGRAQASSRESGERPEFPADVDALFVSLERAGHEGPQSYLEFCDLLRTDRPRAAALLEEARAQHHPALHGSVLWTIGEVADESAIAGLDGELARCVPASSYVPPTIDPPRPPARCPSDNGDLSLACPHVADHMPEDSPERTHALFAMDAYDRVVARQPTIANARSFFGMLDRALGSECDRTVRSMAAGFYLARSRDRADAERRLREGPLRDAVELASIEMRDPRDIRPGGRR